MRAVRGFYMVRMQGHSKANFQSGAMWVEVNELENAVQFKMDYVEKLKGNGLDRGVLEIHEVQSRVKKEELKDYPLDVLGHAYHEKGKGMQYCAISEKEPHFVNFVQEWYRDEITSLEVVSVSYRKVRAFLSKKVTLENDIVTLEEPEESEHFQIEFVELKVNGKREWMRYRDTSNPYLQDRFNSTIEFSNDMQRSVEIVGTNAEGKSLTIYEAIGKTKNEAVVFDEFGLFQGIVVYLDKPELFKLYGFEKIEEMTVYLDGKKQDIAYDRTKNEDLAHLGYSRDFEEKYDKELTGYEVKNYRKVTSKDIRLKYDYSIKDEKQENGILVSLVGIGFKEEHIQELGILSYK